MLTEDPRVAGEHVRQLPGEHGTLTLVGVVHDHPASTHRVRAVLERTDTEVLALELPPLTVPLYEEYADDSRTPPPFGGEMSAAIQAATTGRVVGVDGPSPAFIARLLRNLVIDAASPGTAWSVLRTLPPVAKQAILCRLASVLAVRADLRVEVDSPTSHSCDPGDTPTEQAADEQSQIDRARLMSRAFTPPAAARVRTLTRNQHMASRLSTVRRSGDTVAVVGIAHLDPLGDRLAG